MGGNNKTFIGQDVVLYHFYLILVLSNKCTLDFETKIVEIS